MAPIRHPPGLLVDSKLLEGLAINCPFVILFVRLFVCQELCRILALRLHWGDLQDIEMIRNMAQLIIIQTSDHEDRSILIDPD